MGKTRILAQSILNAADFPGEILTGVPVVELKGSAEAVIQGHRGIIAYGEDGVRIATAIGPLLVTGETLRIFRMNRERIVIQGKLRRVELEETPC